MFNCLFLHPGAAGILQVMACLRGINCLLVSQRLYLCYGNTILLRYLLVALAPFIVYLLHKGGNFRRYIGHYKADITITLLANEALAFGILQGLRERARND